MKIAQSYSHLNGKEFLLVRHKGIFKEINSVIKSINANNYKTKTSKEARKKGRSLYSPKALNKAFEDKFRLLQWYGNRYNYYITQNRQLMLESIRMPFKEQRDFLFNNGEKNPISSYNQTDFVKNKIAIEVQFGKYSFVAYDLFVKHMMFYSGELIDVGIEILPTKKMQEKCLQE